MLFWHVLWQEEFVAGHALCLHLARRERLSQTTPAHGHCHEKRHHRLGEPGEHNELLSQRPNASCSIKRADEIVDALV